MKTIEQKAKAYDEALKKLRTMRDAWNNLETDYSPKDVVHDIEYYFPELKESEDKNVRKFVQYMKKEAKAYEINLSKRDYDIHAFAKDIFSWFKKQGEQKSTDKVEPKFKVGDWVMYCGNPYQITGLHNDTFTLTGCDASYLFNNVKSTDEPVFRLWTIQDAKDGDVLSYNDGHGNDCIELIKSITDKKIEFWFCLSNGNHYELFDGIVLYTNIASREDANPATKEQRDFLFQKMKEAGYEWDAEKLELRKIVAKPEVDIEAMVEEYRNSLPFAVLKTHGDALAKAYKQGLTNMNNIMKKG